MPVQVSSAASVDADLWVTAVGAAGAAVTLTLPAAAARFHRIAWIEIIMYATAARTGGATPVTVTSTNLPGNPAWTHESAQAVGTCVRRVCRFPAGSNRP